MKFIGAFLVYILLPAIGLYLFLRIKSIMKAKNISDAPMKSIFILFFTYGGLIQLIYTELFSHWSGMASIGSAYLILVAPILLGIIGYREFNKRNKSVYHKWVYLSSVLYFAICPIVFIGLVLFEKMK